VERSGQISVQNEQRLKPYCGSPEAAGQAPPLLKPARQAIFRGRRSRPRDWKIFIRDSEEVNDNLRPQLQNPPIIPPAPNPLILPTQAEDLPSSPNHSRPATPPGNLEEAPPIRNILGQPDTATTNTLEKEKRDRIPPEVLG